MKAAAPLTTRAISGATESPVAHVNGSTTDTCVDMACAGSFKGALWNAQGLFARMANKQEAKWTRVHKLMIFHDCVISNESHSTLGKAQAQREMLRKNGITTYWPHADHRRAGVGILIKDKFLAQFRAHEPQWVEIQEGEAGPVRLQGEHGNLDIYAVYFHTGSQGAQPGRAESLYQKRCQLRSKVVLAYNPIILL